MARKYRPGRKITSISQLVKTLERDDFVCLHGHGKTQHKGWVLSLQLHFLLQEIRAGRVRKAVPL